jgi:integrase
MAVYLRGRCKKKHRHSDQCMTWYYDFMIRRRRYKEAIPEARTKAEAEEVEVKEKKEVYEGRYGRPSGDNDFCKFVDDIYLPYSHENKSSWYHDEFRCAVLKEFFKGKRFSEITQLLIVKYINVRLSSETIHTEKVGSEIVQKRRSPTTVRKEVALLSMIFNMAIDEDKAIRNPCRKLPKSILNKIPTRNKRSRVLSEAEEELLYQKGLIGAREHLEPLVTLALHTGIRRGGLLGLKPEDLNFGQTSVSRVINVRGLEKRFEIKPNHLLVLKNKGGRPYAVPLNRVARDVLEKLCAGRDAGTWLFLNKSTGQAIKDIKRSFTSACRKAGITDLRFHDLRHTFATRLKESHVDPITRRDLMGHATTEMTDDYTHSFTETKQDAVERLAVRQKNCPKIVPSQIQQHVLRAVSA